MLAKKSIVVGYAGQDGSLLMNDLKQRGDKIIGIGRTNSLFPKDFLNDSINDITKANEAYQLIKSFKPDEIYYLAAYHTSSEVATSQVRLYEQFEAAQSVHVSGLLNCLSAIVDESPKTRLFYASSSLIYSGEHGKVQDEQTPITPQGFYGITKAQGTLLCGEFRKKKNVFASTGILYNHESHLRSQEFLSAKIINAAIRISRGSDEKLEIGNLSSQVDWGYARDYVKAFQQILATDKADDFIIASGESHRVEEFVQIVFGYFGLDPAKYVVENRNILMRSPDIKIGNSNKLFKITGWKPSMSYHNFVVQLINDHLTEGKK